MHGRITISSSAERRIRREARSAARREIALKLRQGGKTYASIGAVLGVSPARVLQMLRKAERLFREHSSEEGAPARERPSDSDDPLAAGRHHEHSTWYPPPTT